MFSSTKRADVFFKTPLRTPFFVTHLHPRFGQSYPHCDFLAHENVRIMSLGETPFQFIQLGWRKSRPMPLLLARLLRVLEGNNPDPLDT